MDFITEFTEKVRAIDNSPEKMEKVMATIMVAMTNKQLTLNQVRQIEAKLASEGSIRSGAITERLTTIALAIPLNDPDVPEGVSFG